MRKSIRNRIDAIEKPPHNYDKSQPEQRSYQYSDYMNEAFQHLTEVPSNERAQEFLKYCREALAAYDRGEVSLRDAGYAIAGTTFIKEISDDPDLEDITLMAGHLELPVEVAGGQTAVDEIYRELLETLEIAERRLSS